MNNDVDIRVEGLGKRYQLGQTLDLTRTFREMLMSVPAYARHKARQALTAGRAASSQDPETPEGTFWALRDINFEIKRGEVVGIIGRNGAGKSTLLKILSRVTHPTAGRAEIRGRVGALLEVGTGFHPELTGRENVYLNGAILGMRRAEIDRKFDEIVAFAEVDQFLETPVKRYSSGMRVRLGFAVAAHLEPEILVVDEVLSVGDAAFRKKCLGKMKDVSGHGRTVLFISHNMPSIRSLCPRAILLENGRIHRDGPASEVIKDYLGETTGGLHRRTWNAADEKVPGDDIVRLQSVQLRAPGCEESQGQFECGDPIELEVVYRTTRISRVVLQFVVKDGEGQVIFLGGDFQDMRWANREKSPGEYRIVCHLPGNFFAPGTHFIDLALVSYSPQAVHCTASDVLSFIVEDDLKFGGSRGFKIRAEWPATVIRPKFEYSVYLDGQEI